MGPHKDIEVNTMTRDTTEILSETIQNLEELAESGGYREKKELIETVKSLSWFDNFSEEFHHRRLDLLDNLDVEVSE